MGETFTTKLDDTISDLCYITDCLRALKAIYNAGDCNICSRSKDCEYRPGAGQMVRFNCPFYKAKKKKPDRL